MNKHLSGQLRRLVALVAVGLIAGCGQSSEDQQQEHAQAPAVQVITAQPQRLALSSELPGRIEPTRVAEVRARVAGIVLNRKFDEGSDVKAGQVLFQIDPAPFEASLARAEAALFQANATVKRYGPLVEIEAVSQQDYDAAQAAYRTAAANVKTARLDLEYATVRAPISGRIGRALVTEGALVGQGEATPLATIQQINPVYADFKQAVGDVLRLRADAGAQQAASGGKGAPISITVEGTEQKREGHLVFSDITVDRTTGQVLLRGQFDNRDGLLLPGMYVRVQTGQGTVPDAILVPQRAVQRTPDGKAQVIVIGEDDIAEARTIQTGAMYGSNWHVAEGLKAGERVVVDGATKARPGEKVTIEQPEPAKAAAPTPSDARP